MNTAALVAVLCLAMSFAAQAQATPEAASPAWKFSPNTGPLRIAIVRLIHAHVEGLLSAAAHRDDLTIVGIYEPDRAVFSRFAAKYNLNETLRYDSLDAMLDATRPETVSVMGSIKDHLAAVEACAPRGVHLLLEKPLAFTADDAHRMAALGAKHGVLILTNFETSWYASVRHAKRLVDSGQFSPIRRLDFRHGHKGPVEIGCPPEFLAWLTDPAENGGGALIDFGCYGAGLATWLMNGQRPTSIVATAHTTKPDVYPKVDDNATIVLTYPTATAVVQASWAWTHDNKEMDVFTESGSIHSAKWDALTTRVPDKPARIVKPDAKPASLANEWAYLRCVIRGQCEIDPLSSIENNTIVAEILDAARAQVARAKSDAARATPTVTKD